MYTKLTPNQLAQLADMLSDAIHQPAIKRYCTEIYGLQAHSAQVQVHRLSNGSLLSLRVLVFDEEGVYLYPNRDLTYWRRVARQTDIFEGCMTHEQKQAAAESYLLMCQVPQEYGISPIQTEQLVLHEIKSLADIEIYVFDGLPVATLNLSYVEEKEALPTH